MSCVQCIRADVMPIWKSAIPQVWKIVPQTLFRLANEHPKFSNVEGKGMDGKGMKAAGFVSQFPCRLFRCRFPPGLCWRSAKVWSQ